MRNLKKTVSVLLATFILFSCFGTAMAYAADNYDHLPQVYVEGFESKKIYYKDDPEKTSLFLPLDTDKLLGNLGKFAEYAEQAVNSGNPDILYECVTTWMDETFGDIALGTDGYTMSDKVTVDPTRFDYDGDGKYIFEYDSRLDPVDIARELDEYIKLVQAHSGSQKFELVGSSYGTAVVVAYLNEYKEQWENIDSVLLCVPSVGGVNFVGELFKGEINLDPDAVDEFVSGMEVSDELSLFISVLNKCGALDAIIESFLQPTLRIALIRSVKDVVHDIFGTFPGMWTYVQDDDFYDAVEYIYGEDYASPDHEYAQHIARITYYHDNIMVKRQDILDAFKASGNDKEVAVIAKYGNYPIPLSEDGNFAGDGFIELKVASFGATCGLNGEKLPADYTQALYNEYNFISADGTIDASTGHYPFTTWYIKGLWHGSKNDDYRALINDIIYNDITVFDDPAHPQFLQTTEEDEERLVPLGETQPEKKTTWLEDFLALLPRIFKIIFEKLTELFSK